MTSEHDQPCHFCGELCSSGAGDPSRWPVALCHADAPGVMRWHHAGCVKERLSERDEARARVAELEAEVVRLREEEPKP